MKTKTSLLAALACFITFISTSQTTPNSKKSLAISTLGGANINNIRNAPGDLRMGHHFGLEVEKMISKKFGYGVDAMYSNKGNFSPVTSFSTIESLINEDEPISNIELHLNYLTATPYAKFRLGAFYAKAGVFLGVLHQQKIISNNFLLSSEDLGYETLDYGIMGGLGFQKAMFERIKLHLEIVDNFGTANILQKTANTSFEDHLKSNTLELRAGIGVYLKK